MQLEGYSKRQSSVNFLVIKGGLSCFSLRQCMIVTFALYSYNATAF